MDELDPPPQAPPGDSSDEASLLQTYARTERTALDRNASDKGLAREHAHAALALGFLRLTQRRFDDAVAMLERAVTILETESPAPPELLRAHMGAAEVHAMTGFDERARQHLRAVKRLLRKVPTSPERDELSSALDTVTERIATLPLAPLAAQTNEPTKRYRHAKFGDGTLIGKRDANLHVRFDDGVERWLIADRVTLIDS